MEYAISIGLYFAFVIGVCLHIIKNVDTPSIDISSGLKAPFIKLIKKEYHT